MCVGGAEVSYWATWQHPPLPQVELQSLYLNSQTLNPKPLTLTLTLNPQPLNPAIPQVELQSREALVTWVAYCLMHQAACQKHPLLAKCACVLVCVHGFWPLLLVGLYVHS